MKTLFIRSSLILLSATSIFAMEEKMESLQKMSGYFEKSDKEKSPINFSVTSRVSEICLEDKINNDKACFSKDEICALVFAIAATQRALKDVRPVLDYLDRNGFPAATASLKGTPQEKIDVNIETPDRQHTFSTGFTEMGDTIAYYFNATAKGSFTKPK